MQYKKKSTGQVLDVLETDAAKRRILERSGWVLVPATVEPELAEPPTPPVEVPPVEVPPGEVPPGEVPPVEVPPGEVPPEQPALVDDLPEDFPEREALTAAGYGALLLVSKASDDDLRAVKGVGKATLKAIRDYANHG